MHMCIIRSNFRCGFWLVNTHKYAYISKQDTNKPKARTVTDLFLAPETDAIDGRYAGLHRPMPERILDAVAAATGVGVPALRGRQRTRPVARARHAAYWMLAQHTSLSLPAIGARLGGRDHTSVLHGLRRANVLRAEDANFQSVIARAERRIGACPR